MSEQDRVREALASGEGKTIGALVMWSLDGVQASRERFEGFFDSLGFDGGRIASKVPSFHALLRRAATETKPKLPPGWLLREASKTSARIVYACVKETRDEGAAQLSHSQEANVAVFRDWSIATNEKDNAAAKLLMERFEFLRDMVTSSDVSRAMVQAITHRRAMGGVCFTGRGGAYFISPDYIDAMKTIAVWVKAHGGPRTEVSIFEITDSAENRSQAAKKLEQEFSSQCAGILEELKEFIEKTKSENGEEPKSYLVNRREVQFRELEDRVDSFAAVLGEVRGELKERIREARGEMYQLTTVNEALAANFEDE